MIIKCKFEKESISSSFPDIIYIRCKHPSIQCTTNCIGYENCADYEEDRKDSYA